MKESGFKRFWRKFWFIVWKDDSMKGWIMSIIFLFVVVKFIFFPFLNLVTGTTLPLAIVESCSMYHDKNILSNFEDWWTSNQDEYKKIGIERSEFEEFGFKRGFNKGDILFITGVNTKKIELGDVIIFQSGIQKTPIIHRVVQIKNESGNLIFSTKGDNVEIIQGSEKEISEDQIIGKARARIIPYAGWVKLIFYEPFFPQYKKGFCREN